MCSNTSIFPHKIQDLNPETTNKLLTLFPGQKQGFIKVGERNYLLPEQYSDVATQIYNMDIRSDDIWVITFSRSGTTWTQELVWLLNNNLNYEEAKKVPQSERFTYVEFPIFQEHSEKSQSLRNLKNLEAWPASSRRFIKSHLPPSLLPPQLSQQARVVYVARDPRDVAVSYYHFSRLFKSWSYAGNFREFWDLFRNDLVTYGPVLQHVLECWEMRHNPNVLFLFYEDLSSDLMECARRTAHFLGQQYSEEQLQELCTHLAFDKFKKNESVNLECQKGEIFHDNEEQFIRKGQVGNWRQYFDKEMQDEAERWMEEQLAGTDLRFPGSKPSN